MDPFSNNCFHCICLGGRHRPAFKQVNTRNYKNLRKMHEKMHAKYRRVEREVKKGFPKTSIV
jgi:hypothetical protein